MTLLLDISLYNLYPLHPKHHKAIVPKDENLRQLIKNKSIIPLVLSDFEEIVSKDTCIEE